MGKYCKFKFKGEIYYGTITSEYDDYFIIKVKRIYPYYFFKEDVTIIYKMTYER